MIEMCQLSQIAFVIEITEGVLRLITTMIW